MLSSMRWLFDESERKLGKKYLSIYRLDNEIRPRNEFLAIGMRKQSIDLLDNTVKTRT